MPLVRPADIPASGLRDAVTSADGSTLGARISMVDAEERVTGAIGYALNVELPRMLHAAILRSPHAHAKIVSIDTSYAMRLPGVVAALSAEDFRADAAFDATMGLFARDEPLVA